MRVARDNGEAVVKGRVQDTVGIGRGDGFPRFFAPFVVCHGEGEARDGVLTAVFDGVEWGGGGIHRGRKQGWVDSTCMSGFKILNFFYIF